MKINYRLIILFSLIAFSLYWVSTFNYLLFHSLAEIFSISIAFTVFILTWNSQKYLKSNYLVLLGIAYLFIGILDLFHTLSYRGMSIFADYDYYANQLWIATRFIESMTLLIAMSMISRERKIPAGAVFIVYTVLTSATLLSIITWKIFPVCFIEDIGQTRFKKNSEYIISVVLLLALILLKSNRKKFTQKIYLYMLWTIILTILSEMAFAFYISNYGISNMIGHYFKILSFYLIYKAIISEGIQSPYESIFRDLMNKEDIILKQNKDLLDVSRKDGMTGLYNHEYLFTLLKKEIERSIRYENNLTIIMYDLDNFKKLNDEWGHPEGDRILIETASIIRTSLRESDMAGRYGGEEFLIILPETDESRGIKVAEKIRTAIQLQFVPRQVTISGGVAALKKGMSERDLISLADKRLYISKGSGKNRITPGSDFA